MFVVYGSINKVPAMYDPCHHRGVLTPRAAVNSPGYNEPFTSFQWTDKEVNVTYHHWNLIHLSLRLTVSELLTT